MSGPAARTRPNWTTLVLVVLLHLLAIIGLARAFAPGLTAQAIERVAAVLTVTITAPETIPAAPMADAGAAAPAGKKAMPREQSAPAKTIPLRPSALPPVAGEGSDDHAGAALAGPGSGKDGAGIGTGSGNSGNGQGNAKGTGSSRKVEKIAGDINSALDYPVPPGGREARFGTSVTIALTVGPDGVPSACRIVIPSPFPETDAITCRLAFQRFRFRPATGPDGMPISATYGWRQEFQKMR